MSCEYMARCPSSSAWCRRAGCAPSGECVPFLLTAFELMMRETGKALYLCDQKQCEQCSGQSFGQCFRTTQLAHARNFEAFADGVYIEKYLEE